MPIRRPFQQPQRHSRLLCYCCLVVLTTFVASGIALEPVTAAPPVRKAKAKPGENPPQQWGTKLPKAVTEKPAGSVLKVAPLVHSRKDVDAAARKVDDLLESHWKEHGAKPSEPLDDHEFVRRAYLEIIGRIPTIEEAEAFLRSGGDKRGKLIDDLLVSPGYVSHTYNFWADILRLQERPSRDIWFEPYMSWVKDSIASNKPYDQWVFEMLTASGRIWENPATGFQLRDAGMPLSYTDNTVRVFLGTQIGCAQCHDHPFDKWTQKQFYQLAALTNGTRYSVRQAMFPGMGMFSSFSDEGPAPTAMPDTFKNRDDLIPNIGRLNYGLQMAIDEGRIDNGIRNFLGANTQMMSYQDTEFRLPFDYRYDDAQPLDVIEAGVLWGDVPSTVAHGDQRTQFAGWLTSRENRQFARAIANRLWKRVMGVGLVEPIDDFQDGNEPLMPELLDHLTDEILRLDFDLREFVRVLYSTKTYGQLAVVFDPTAAEPFRFTGPALKRMTAEQLWDSLLTLIAVNEWAYQRPTTADLAPFMGVDISTVSYEQFEEAYKKYRESASPGAYRRTLQKACGYKDLYLVRASEQPTPSPLNHMLRQFGQGDRESIQGGRQVATVPQILTMFNGWMTHAMLEEGSVIFDAVAKQKSMRSAVDTIFLAVLTHTPDAETRRLAESEIRAAANPAAGCGDLIWSLLNTREFLFIE